MTTVNQLDQLQALREQLQGKHTRLSERLAELTKQMEAVELTIALLRDDRKEADDILGGIAPRELHGMTQLEAIVHLAKKANGRVRIALARDALKRAGMLKGKPQNWYNLLTTVIKRSGRFRHTGAGEYELIEEDKPVVSIRKATVA